MGVTEVFGSFCGWAERAVSVFKSVVA